MQDVSEAEPGLLREIISRAFQKWFQQPLARGETPPVKPEQAWPAEFCHLCFKIPSPWKRLLALMACTHSIPMMLPKPGMVCKWCPKAFHGMHGALVTSDFKCQNVGNRVACPWAHGSCLGCLGKSSYTIATFPSPQTCTSHTRHSHWVHMCRGKGGDLHKEEP